MRLFGRDVHIREASGVTLWLVWVSSRYAPPALGKCEQIGMGLQLTTSRYPYSLLQVPLKPEARMMAVDLTTYRYLK